MAVRLFCLFALAVNLVIGVTGQCPNGWTRHDKNCYLFVDIPEAWQDASSHCQAMDAQLASIKTARQDTFLRNFLLNLHKYDPNHNAMYWVDGSDIATETEWVWSFSEQPILNYTNWCVHQPDNAGSKEDCLRLGAFCGFKWDDGDCETKEHFICQREDTGYFPETPGPDELGPIIG